MRDSDEARQRARMVERQMEARGVTAPRVLAALRLVPRHRFVPPALADRAYSDHALPIAEGQTISQPYVVAVMTQALSLQGSERVLEIGTGSGYQTAVLACLAAEVHTVECIPSLAGAARTLLADLDHGNVRFHLGDGSKGWREAAPYEAIVVTAGAPLPPPSLLAQLHPDGGRLVVPVGDRRLQQLVRVTRRGTEYDRENLLGCRFVPLVGAEGWPADDDGP